MRIAMDQRGAAKNAMVVAAKMRKGWFLIRKCYSYLATDAGGFRVSSSDECDDSDDVERIAFRVMVEEKTKKENLMLLLMLMPRLNRC